MGMNIFFHVPWSFWGGKGIYWWQSAVLAIPPNIVNAIQAAQGKGMQVVTFSGFQRDNRIRGIGVCSIYVPSSKYGIVESIHNIILQQIVDMVMERDGECL